MNHGFHRTPLVPSRVKALQYVLPCAVRAAQCRLSNEVNGLGCAAQYDWRARADAQLRIDWKVRHGYLTPSCGPSSIHRFLPKTFEPTAGQDRKHADGRTLRSRHSLASSARSAAKRARRTRLHDHVSGCPDGIFGKDNRCRKAFFDMRAFPLRVTAPGDVAFGLYLGRVSRIP